MNATVGSNYYFLIMCILKHLGLLSRAGQEPAFNVKVLFPSSVLQLVSHDFQRCMLSTLEIHCLVGLSDPF